MPNNDMPTVPAEKCTRTTMPAPATTEFLRSYLEAVAPEGDLRHKEPPCLPM